MTIAHTNYLEAIRTATTEKPVAVSMEFFDHIQAEDPTMYHIIQCEIKAKTCVLIPAGYQLAEV